MRAVPIIRSRTGCFTCRRRKKKCNEEKPVCIGCKRNKLECTWPADRATQGQQPHRNRDNNAVSASATSKLAASSASSPTSPLPEWRSSDSRHSTPTLTVQLQLQLQQAQPVTSPLEVVNSDAFEDASDKPMTPASPITPFETLPSPIPDNSLVHHHVPNDPALALVFGRENLTQDNIYMHDNIPINMSLLPSHGHDSFELLSYYLARTANSMGNGSTDSNPFVAKLIPLAFSDPLVLHLILAQSAVHRQASDECSSGGEVATRYYTDSLRMFRRLVGEYVSGRNDDNLVVTVGSLILCLTEVARGDANGTIFDHLAASESLLTNLLNRHEPAFSDDLQEFLVEYYMHMVASSMISKDPRGTSQAALSPAIENAAKRLLSKNYMGQLCGCWLEILTIIPQVFQLGQSMLRTGDEPGLPTSPDDIITFGLLQSQILAFMPPIVASTNSQLAGLVFKQATLLYLWSIFGTPQHNAPNTMHSDLMNSAIMEAVSFLSQLPASERVNTSLCWPLAVIGCCTTDAHVQHVLRQRLQAMIDIIGLGNMRQTLALLEHVWEQPPENMSPWTLRRVMQQYEIWISFA
ncbi:hypothetical protein UVI_02043600 [Ustilaginoidea virens]|uniref:Zn(2)-C6 fungal-type domain-containing protein n=1 Tax=Ustilaginoidea virens TaxID=1159556 RepID=A0A1B5LAD8_USTVR|nr:hypothetical protein UVI_02043600 [Ustilaginoidea virens]